MRWRKAGPGRRIASAAALVASLAASEGRGQAVGAFPSAPGSPAVQVGATLEPELVVSIGYMHRLDPGTSPWGFAVGVGLEVPPYLLDHGAGRLSLVGAGKWVRERSWGMTASSAVYLARDRNRAGTMHGLGLEVRAAPGYHGSGWSVAADLGWQGTLVAHMSHSDLVRETFRGRYPDGEGDGPKDGWYGLTAQRFRLGVAGGRRLGQGLSARLAAGALFSRQEQGLLLSFAHGQVPVYLEASVKVGGR